MRILRSTTTGRSPRFALGVAAVAAVLAMSGCVADGADRGELDLTDSFTDGQVAYTGDLLVTTDATDAYCHDGADCLEAVSNQYLSILTFDSEGAAQNYLDSIGENAYQFGNIVVHFDGGTPVTDDERETVLNALTIAEAHTDA